MLFKNVGEKIKTLALIIFAFSLIGGLGSGIALMILSKSLILLGFIIMFVLPLLGYVSAMMLYGFGELIENSAIIAGKQAAHKSEKLNEETYDEEKIYDEPTPFPSQPVTGFSAMTSEEADERLDEIEQFYANGIISKAEYRHLLQKLQATEIIDEFTPYITKITSTRNNR